MGSLCLMVDKTVRNAKIVDCLVSTVSKKINKQVASESCVIFLFVALAATRKG